MTIKELITIGFNDRQYKVILYCIMKRDTDGFFRFGKEEVKELTELTWMSPRTIRRNFNVIEGSFFVKQGKNLYQFEEGKID
jgi:hypothetical protein